MKEENYMTIQELMELRFFPFIFFIILTDREVSDTNSIREKP